MVTLKQPSQPTLQHITDLFAHPPRKTHQGVKSSSLYLTMRDGIQIAVDVMLPAELSSDTRFPVIMIMARYWRSMELRIPNPPNKALIGPREAIVDDLVSRGFAFVVVDARGTGASTGISRYPWAPEELADYGEVAQWVLTQPWCKGSIGAVGISYEGSTAQHLLATGVQGVKAAAPMEYEFDVYTDIAMPGGVFNMAFIREWHESNSQLDNHRPSNLFPWLVRPLVKGVRPVDSDRKTRAMLAKALQDHQHNTNVYEAMAKIVSRDDKFGQTGATLDDFSVFTHQKAIEASNRAIFVWGSWLDGTTADTVLRTFNTFSNPQIGVIGAWKHEMTAHGSPFQKPKGKPDPLQAHQWDAVAQFFEQTLKHDTPLQGKILFYYTLGAETWKQTDVFPLPNTEMQSWYFQAEHGLAPTKPTAASGYDVYQVDFNATTGRTNRWHTQMAKPLVYPNRAKEDQRLLTYTSDPLTQDLEITGYPVITLHLTSTHEDGAFFVYLEDIDESGTVRYITEGQLRGIHRQRSSQTPPYWSGVPYRTYKRADIAPLPIGEQVELTFGLNPTSVLIRRGHRIRVALAGADQDTFVRIPSQGDPRWQVFCSVLAASCIHLPIIR